MDEMLIALAPVNWNNEKTGLLKNMVLDPGWFDRDKIKFENW